MDFGEMTYSHQRGEPGHCFVAQVYGPDGKSVAEIEPTADPTVATGYARRFAASAELLAALQAAKSRLFGAGPATDPLYATIRDAIAKAEG